MKLFYSILVLLLLARTLGEVCKRIGQPVLVGELVAGIVVGGLSRQFPDVFPILSTLVDDHAFEAVTELAIFFLMLLAGLELRPKDLYRAGGRSTAVALGGMLLPIGLGVLLGLVLLPESELKSAQTLFLAVALAITAVPVAVKVLMDMGALRSRVGTTIVAAAVIDDLLSLVLLGLLTAVLNTGSVPGAAELLRILLSTLAFLVVAWLVGRYALPWLGGLAHRSRLDYLEFTFVLVAALLLAVLAEALGLHFILGAFAAGLFFQRSTIDTEAFEAVNDRVEAVSSGFLAPIFFAYIGMQLDLSALTEAPLLVLIVLAAATAGKVLGAGVPARLAGVSWRESLAIGLGMNARGAVELVIAGIALEAGLFEQPQPQPPSVAYLFSAVVIMAIATTLATGLALRPVLGDRAKGQSGS